MNVLSKKYDVIKEYCQKSKSTDPISLAIEIMKDESISINGPEHHFLDGAAFLTAFKNAGGSINLEKALSELSKRSILMPGAICGYWGVCGSASSLGAALAIINNTNPLSDNEYYKDNLEFTSSVLKTMSKIGGPRCCKRNAFISISTAVSFVKRKYNINMTLSVISCDFYSLNPDCIQKRCPFYKK